MQRQHTPLRSSPRAAYEHTLSDTNTHTHTSPLPRRHTGTHTSESGPPNEWAVNSTLSCENASRCYWMAKCANVTVWHISIGVGGRARPRACMRACSWVKIILRWAPFEAWTWKTNKNHTLLKCKIRMGFLVLVFFFFSSCSFFFFFFLKTGFIHLWCSTYALPPF